MSNYDVIVIGSGPGGYVAAIHAAQRGQKTAIIEKDKTLGGTCLNRGCIPTKALLEAAHVYENALRAGKFGVKVENVSFDWAEIQKYRDRTVRQNTGGVSYLMTKNKITVHKGHGRLTGKGGVSVTGADGKVEQLTGKQIILATGSVCKNLPFIPMDHERIINSDDILQLSSIPQRLIIMGAGAVGTEFASIYHTFGSKVTLLEMAERILPIEDHEVSEELAKIFRAKGIEVLVGNKTKKVERVGDVVRVEVEHADGKIQVIEGDTFLMAAGRQPVSYDLGLEHTQVKVTKRGTVEVDPFMKTDEPGVYAIGDLIDTPWLAHVAYAEAALAVEHFLGDEVQPINYVRTPSCTYCHPEVASIGLTEKAAKEKGYEVRVGKFPFSANPRARIMQESEGFVKIVADAKYDEVLGVHIIGPKATELILEGGMALALESTVEEIIRTMHAHPTLGEILGEAAHAVHGHTLHM